ncbi:NAD-glutamate dehydrogenase [Nakamurella endophytica]|uniref:Glutamate dehydrogenase n=1 Tax=Nakamurella endophytica TaxID=1748367 RepID=A0A917T0Z7_9ACTN|nr:NAD-glutamate dehydrogenase [Nakamurella endophytica]GGM06956.1 glutamate dehydrogenase [Nakamurella endophytica]
MTQTEQSRSAEDAERVEPSPGAQALDEAADRRPDLAGLVRAYFRHVPADDLPSTADDVLAIVQGHLRIAEVRRPGAARIRFANPPQPAGSTGTWSAASTVIDVVNDDMPNLVDSVIGVLAASGVTVHRVLHPILSVRRDPGGRLVEVLGESGHPADPRTAVRESWMHLVVDRLSDAERAEAIEERMADVLEAVRAVSADAAALLGAAAMVASELRVTPSPLPTQDVAEAADLLHWLTAGHLTFLGYRQDRPGASGPEPVPGSGLGVLRDGVPGAELFDDAAVRADAGGGHLVITQLTSGSALSRKQPPFSVTVRILDGAGRLVRRHRFVGVLTPRAMNAEVTTTPVVRRTVATVLSALGASPDSYTGQQAMDLLSGYPRAELFWADPALVLDVVSGVLQLSSRRRLRAFLQPDPFGRFVNALVYLPRDRYTTHARLAMQQILVDRLHGSAIHYTARIGASEMAAVHFTVHTDPERPVDLDPAAVAELNRALRSTIRTWDDRLVQAVVGGAEDLDTAGALTRYAEAFDEAYKEDYRVDDAVADLRRLDALEGPEDLALAFVPAGGGTAPGPDGGAPVEQRLKLYVTGATVTLSRVLPVLQSMGAEVIDERPYQVRRTDGTPSHIYDFGLRVRTGPLPGGVTDELRNRFSASFLAAWHGRAEVDGFNALVLAAGLDWRQIAVLRAYAHYLRQIGSPYTQRYLEQVLVGHPAIVADLAELFRLRFDPDSFAGDAARAGEARRSACAELAASVARDLDAVASLDADRILRSFLTLIQATVRTNRFRRSADGTARECLSFKLLPHLVPGIPKPVPAFEIWVYSPRVEGVHLRFGPVARGGLRWSDRPEDFRTEILGLVKAQEVKNAVIVPVGAKGGFVLRQPPVPTGRPVADREALQAEGVTCYRAFIAALLDVTDNRVDGAVVPPEDVVRHDEDDSYLVVAADKGTATFSDIANDVAAGYGFWLGDAFASGGSAGYDHKAMGITARGAWESVRHHFRELDVDTQTTDFSCVGIGDMSGDVFGNGMLLSRHIRLLAAFDHRHVFLDPDPDPETSYRERERLFRLPRSSWADYDTALLSPGGGVWPRTAKSVPVTEPVRAALGIPADVTALTPVELIRAVLAAPVDLLWNGGIGTYVKASTETHADVGDKANDAVRVDGVDLRARVVGEGGNLGVTQLGRIEFARAGGRINTDAIDNSAGVDTSDHEVNIKIALQPAVAAGRLGAADRTALLGRMTDDVAALVLADNQAQNRVLGVSRYHSVPMLSVHARLIDALVASGRLDRALEFLPSRAQIKAREAAGEPLTSPELSVLLAYVKSDLTQALLADDLPDDPVLADRLHRYFPAAMQAADPAGDPVADIDGHPLAREIVTTTTVNDVVNTAGITYAFRLSEEIGASAPDAVRAYEVVTAVFGLRELWSDIAALDTVVPAATQDTLHLEVRRLLDRAARWLLTHRPAPLDVAGEIHRYADAVGRLASRMPRLVTGVEHRNVRADAARLTELGSPPDLALRVAYALYTFSLLDVVDVALESGSDLEVAAEVYFALSAHLDFDRMLSAITALQRGDRWHALARQALRDDLYRSMRLITADVLARTDARRDISARIADWEAESATRLARARTTLAQIAAAPAVDLAALSVGASEFRGIVG